MVCLPRLTMIATAAVQVAGVAQVVVWPNLLAAVLATTFYFEQIRGSVLPLGSSC
jgi:hypothetical protein